MVPWVDEMVTEWTDGTLNEQMYRRKEGGWMNQSMDWQMDCYTAEMLNG